MAEIIVLTPPGDNFIFLAKGSGGRVVVVDPGTAEPVLEALGDSALEAILVTHHHADHRGGVHRLVEETGATVWSATPTHGENLVTDGDILRFGDLVFRVIATPGHTADSVCYLLETESGPHALFSGDTLFAGGCGRVFEGEPEELYHSLKKLGDLDPETAVYPGHDYTEDNYRFALSVEPEHASYGRALKRVESEKGAGLTGIPSTIGEEHRSNIFLRAPDAALFAELRRAKNRF
jgi:hydroxyacylglutathione hydrolase